MINSKNSRFYRETRKNRPSKKKVFSYAGAWSIIDKNVFKDLTENLIPRRQIQQNFVTVTRSKKCLQVSIKILIYMYWDKNAFFAYRQPK